MSSGLTFTADTVKISINSGSEETVGTTNTNNIYYVNSSQVLTVYIKDLLQATGYDKDSATTITITYQAKLNDSATLGNGGNENKVYLTYSNNPYDTSDTGTTTTDLTETYTTSLTVYKTNGSSYVSGAGFTLYDSNNDPVGTEDQQVPNTGLTFSGLTAGIYTLKETTVPNGYNTASNIVFTLSYDETNGWSVTVTSPSTASISEISTDSGTFETTVINNAGTIIPATGGMGTTILYIVGAILVIGAAVILVTRRRMANK